MTRGSDPTERDWRAPFRARITGQSSVAGVRRFTWVEQSIDPDDASTEDASFPRTGTSDSGWAVTLNNEDVPNDSIVWMRFRCMVAGVPVYEVQRGGGTTIVNGDQYFYNVTNVTFLTQYFFVYESSPGTVVILPIDFTRYERYWKTTYENSIDGAWYFGGEPERAGDVTLASTAANADLLYAMPILEAKGRKIRNIAFWLTNAAGGGAVRIGIYTNSSTDYPYPDTLVYDSGELSADTTPDDEGLRQVSPCYQTQPGSLYWLAFLCDFTSTAITIKTVDSAECWCVIGNDDTWTTNDAGCGWAVTQTYGALPDPFPEDAEPVTGGQLPAIGVQYGDCDSSEGGDGTLDLEEMTLDGTGTYTGPPPVPITACCDPDYDVPSVLTLTITTCGGGAGCVGQTSTLTYNSGTGDWEGTLTCAAINWTFALYCDGGTNLWTLYASCGAFDDTSTASSDACDPLSLTFNKGTWVDCCTGLGGFICTVTE